jgi:hypothetical protein
MGDSDLAGSTDLFWVSVPTYGGLERTPIGTTLLDKTW